MRKGVSPSRPIATDLQPPIRRLKIFIVAVVLILASPNPAIRQQLPANANWLRLLSLLLFPFFT